MKHVAGLTAAMCGLIILFTGWWGQSAQVRPLLGRFEFQQVHMACPVRCVVYARSHIHAENAALAAFRRISELEAIFSDYRPDSEVSRLCQNEVGRAVPVSCDLLYVMRHVQRLAAETDGAFDVTVGPLTRLWRRSRRRRELPAHDFIERSREAVGYRRVTLNSVEGTIVLGAPNMQFDFGGAVKGYAAEMGLREIERQGISRAMVAIEGDIAVGAPPPGKRGWRIELSTSDETLSRPLPVAELSRCSVSTSGDTYQFVEIGGKRYSHILDPMTGWGLTRRVGVTVVAREGLVADSLATALSVMTADAATKWINRMPGTEFCRIEQNSDRLQVIETKGFSSIFRRVD